MPKNVRHYIPYFKTSNVQERFTIINNTFQSNSQILKLKLILKFITNNISTVLIYRQWKNSFGSYKNRSLYFYIMQFSVEFLKLEDFPDEKVAIAMGHFRIGDVDHIMINIKVQLKQTHQTFCLNSSF